MKVSNTVVSVIVIAAVLVTAYAMGLLIRQARTGGSRVPSTSEVKETTLPSQMVPRAAATKDSPEERARIQEEKAKAIKEMGSLTEEQKEKFRNQVRKQVGARSNKGRPDYSSQQRRGQRGKMQSPAEAGHSPADANAPAVPGATTNVTPSAEQTGSEPGKAGPG